MALRAKLSAPRKVDFMRFFHQPRARLDGLRRFGLAGRRPGCPSQAPFVAVTLARCWKVFVFCAATAMPFSHVRAQTSEEDIAKFQLYTACQPFRLMINLSGAEDIGLTEQAVVNAAESRIRAARLYSSSGMEILEVRIAVYFAAYTIQLRFAKLVDDYRSNIPHFAITWDISSIGGHGGYAPLILDNLSEYLDKFLVEFLRVNESACNDPQ